MISPLAKHVIITSYQPALISFEFAYLPYVCLQVPSLPGSLQQLNCTTPSSFALLWLTRPSAGCSVLNMSFLFRFPASVLQWKPVALKINVKWLSKKKALGWSGPTNLYNPDLWLFVLHIYGTTLIDYSKRPCSLPTGLCTCCPPLCLELPSSLGCLPLATELFLSYLLKICYHPHNNKCSKWAKFLFSSLEDLVQQTVWRGFTTRAVALMREVMLAYLNNPCE